SAPVLEPPLVAAPSSGMSRRLLKPGLQTRTIPMGVPSAASNDRHLGPYDAPAATLTDDQYSHGPLTAVSRSTPADLSLKSNAEAEWLLSVLLMNLTSTVTNTLPDSGVMNSLPDCASYLKLVTSTIHPLASAQGLVQLGAFGDSSEVAVAVSVFVTVL